MCGINGIFAYAPAANAVDRAELLRVRDTMIERGPDGAGVWTGDDGRIGLGHRRLAILDLSAAGAQPMHSADGTLVVSFNGEIYNYPELRGDLERAGVEFRSHSDTEVLLHLYRRHGPAMVGRLRGMFAFALWDARARSLLLARDPHGHPSRCITRTTAGPCALPPRSPPCWPAKASTRAPNPRERSDSCCGARFRNRSRSTAASACCRQARPCW